MKLKDSKIKIYLKSISPTKVGILSILVFIFFLPSIIDIFISKAVNSPLNNSFSKFMLNGFRLIAIALILYHAYYFLSKTVYKAGKDSFEKFGKSKEDDSSE